MNQNTEKKKIESRTTKSQNLIELCDESYRKINDVSFQHNFKDLISHYKKEVKITTQIDLNVM